MTAARLHVPRDSGGVVNLYAIGDSITANGTGTYINSLNFTYWACMLSGGVLRYAGVAATGGFTSAQVLATHVPTAIAANPDACIVLCGLNDMPSFSLATTTANLTSIYQQLQGREIVPILALLTPKAQYAANISLLNVWIRRYAQANNLPLLDFQTTFVATADGGWLAGLDSDGTHPSATGAKQMGQLIATELAPLYSSYVSPMSVHNVDTSNIALPTNSVFLTDTNADGVPNGVSVNGTNGTVVPTLVTGDTAIKGSWFRINKTAGTGDSSYGTSSVAVSVGDRLLACGRINYVSGTPGTTKIQVWLVTDTYSALPELQWDQLVNAPFELPVHTVLAGATTARLLFFASGGTCDVRFAQMTLINLTASGITL